MRQQQQHHITVGSPCRTTTKPITTNNTAAPTEITDAKSAPGRANTPTHTSHYYYIDTTANVTCSDAITTTTNPYPLSLTSPPLTH